MGPSTLSEFVVTQALELGAARAGVTNMSAPERFDQFESWLNNNKHGTMKFMERGETRAMRGDPSLLSPGSKSVICVAVPYDANESKSVENDNRLGRVARYAHGKDYHQVLWGLLNALLERIVEHVGHPIPHRFAVDTAPVLERELAERAGLGFIGKNTMLISPGVGSYVFLGELFIDIELEPTQNKNTVDCGSCRACLDACPTDAFDAPYKLNANRCISYLTIEHRGPIEESLRDKMGNHIFGCDICQSVCPYNKVAPYKQDVLPEFTEKSPARVNPDLSNIASMGSNPRKRFVGDSAMRRADRESLLRNVANALGNSGLREAKETLTALEHDRSTVVQESASWARNKLDSIQ